MLFKTIIKADRNYFKCTIPAEFCKQNKITVSDYLKIKINDKIFPVKVCGSPDKRINLPLYLCKSLNLKPENIIEVEIIEKLERRKRKIKIIENYGGYFLDLYYSLPTRQVHANKELIIFIENNELLVWGKGARNSIQMPRYIELDDRFFEIFGLYQGEGYKKQPNFGARVQFSNSNPEIINSFLDYFSEKFNLIRNNWNASIGYYGKLDKIKVISYWSKITKIEKENIKRVVFYKAKGEDYKKYGTLNIFIISSILVEIILGLLNCTQFLIMKRKKWARAFLRGLLAADGSVKLMKYKNMTSLQMIELALENKVESKFYKNIFKKIGIKTNDYTQRRKLMISNWRNFKVLAQFNAFKLHKEKNEKFWIGFENHTKTAEFLGL